jgi:hypothetical protein
MLSASAGSDFPADYRRCRIELDERLATHSSTVILSSPGKWQPLAADFRRTLTFMELLRPASAQLRILLLYQNLERRGQTMRHDHFARAGTEAQSIRVR